MIQILIVPAQAHPATNFTKRYQKNIFRTVQKKNGRTTRQVPAQHISRCNKQIGWHCNQWWEGKLQYKILACIQTQIYHTFFNTVKSNVIMHFFAHIGKIQLGQGT